MDHRYMNSFADVAVGKAHELTTQLIRALSEIRVMKDTITEKENMIVKLETQKASVESMVEGLKQKSTHLDSALKQLKASQEENTRLKEEIEELKKDEMADFKEEVVKNFKTTKKKPEAAKSNTSFKETVIDITSKQNGGFSNPKANLDVDRTKNSQDDF